MTLASPVFLAFLLAVLLIYRGASRFGRTGLFAITLASLAFYATWNPLLCLPLLATATWDYLMCRALGRTERAGVRRALVTASLALDLSVLGFFKYFNFFAEPALDLWRAGGGQSYEILFRAGMAVGLSFYTFQSLSCVLDVYRKDQEPPRSWLEYLAFVSFFPTLLAGPITRAETLLPQFRMGAKPLDGETCGKALFLITLGFFKKLVLADTIALQLTGRVFELPGMYSSLEVLAGIYGYAAQIYCDFSGYSDIAIGSALLLGISLKDNFDSPYRSADLSEFWRRWHISLSTWLRDYLFFSLPGKRPGTPWPYLNIAVTFTLGGLWHGASWTYVLWGLAHGLGLAFMRLLQMRRRGRPAVRPAWRTVLGVFLTFHFVAFTWLFFRCANLEQVGEVLRRLGALTTTTANLPTAALLAAGAAILAQWAPKELYGRSLRSFVALPAPGQAALILGAALAIHAAGTASVSPFIYFQY
jgi:D-alanyl-lipoteichoic acid acyltransferase DltB (MBOAT superfamily)